MVIQMMDLPPGNVSYHPFDEQRVANLVQQQIDVKVLCIPGDEA